MKFWLVVIVFITGLASCDETHVPRPKAYPRVMLPEPVYLFTEGEEWECPFEFEYSTQSLITVDPRYENRLCWYNIYYPKFRATVHLTYSSVDQDLNMHIEESRKLALKHIGKATQIEEVVIERPEDAVYGLSYQFKGATASDMQFFVTDSSSHFLRGSLYFSARPNKDSLAPIIQYVENDLSHLLQTFNWR